MNQHLQAILDLIQQSEHLSDEEKIALLKAAKDADKQFSITEFKLDRTEKVKRTTAILLEETIEELEQKRKAVEAQNHELEIEGSLERVRSIALSMNEPNNMPEVCRVIAIELDKLGVKEIRNVQTAIFYVDKGTYMNYEYYLKHNKTIITETSYTNHKMHRAFADQMLKGKGEFFTTHMSEAELPNWVAYQKTTNVFIDTYIEKASSLNYYWYSLGPVALGISTYLPLTKKEIDLFKRFRNVFELAYRRYLDIEKAIAQAREAQIELALERVRARTMSMQKSDELPEAANLLFQQVQAMGMPAWSAGYCIWDEDKKAITLWMSSESVMQPPFRAPLTEDPSFIHMLDAHERDETFYVEAVGGDELVQHYKYMRTLPVVGEILDSIIIAGHPLPTFQIFHLVFFSQGFLLFITYEPVPNAHDIFKRFGKVFDQTYTRFLDLQKAEAQAREAQIEAALERVRSRSMGMQKSEELKEVIKIVYQQLTHLKINLDHSGFVVDYTPGGDWHFWIADEQDIPSKITHPYFKSVWANQFNEAKEKGADFFATNLNFEEKNKFYNELLSYVPGLPEASKNFYLSRPGLAASTVLFNNVSLYIENFSGTLYTDEENNILKRFGKVFQQTYTRFLDLQKAEAQAREAKIEAALERTRTQSMIMQHSKELDNTLRVFHEQVQLLGINSAFSFLWLPDEEKDKHIFWAIWEENENGSVFFKNKAINYPLDRNELATKQCLVDWKSDEQVHSYAVPPEGVENYFAAWKELIDGVEKLKPEHFRNGLYYIEAFMKHGCFGVMTQNDLTQDEKKILGRFATEFERTYTRFLDLQKAEAQAREAQIEAALERIRSSAMAMHSSEDILEVTHVLREQVALLGEKELESILVHIYHEDKDQFQAWYSYRHPDSSKVEIVNGKRIVDWSKTERARKDKEKYHEKESDYTIVADRKMLKEWYEYLYKLAPEVVELNDKGEILVPDVLYYNYSKISAGALLLITNSEPSQESKYLLKRAAQVFNLAYSRFLDLQKAEAQAREAQIEASLERVRSKSMAMHHSESLHEVINSVTEQFQQLGFYFDTANFITNYSNDGWEWWISTPGAETPAKIYFPQTDLKFSRQFNDAIKQGSEFTSFSLSYEEKNELFKYIFENTILKHSPEERKQYVYNKKGLAFSTAFFKNIFLSIANYQAIAYSEEENNIIRRFGRVFQQTYTRFLDLQKAEAQAREAKIEASLERVRSKAMAMQKSEDLANAVAIVFEELDKLDLGMLRCGIGIINKGKRSVNVWAATKSEKDMPVQVSGDESMDIHPLLQGAFNAWLKQEEYSYELQGEDLTDYYKKQVSANFKLPDSHSLVTAHEDVQQYYFLATFPAGGLFAFRGTAFSEEAKIVMKRFADVFNLTYTRYNDLQLAEAQVKESQIEAALERVRSRTLAMQKSDELAETSAVLFQQLIVLGIAPNRLYIGVINDESGNIEFWITDEDGTKVSTMFTGNAHENASMKKMYDGWKQQKKSIVIDMYGKELADYFHYLGDELHVPFKDGLLQKRRVQYITYFSKGFIGMASPEEQPKETVDLLERFSYVFNLTFTRFSDLKIAEAHAIHAEEDLIKLQTEKRRAEDALIELKETQKQLIQSEKMASLGELTAGIAHEIQNPLNFVNNFSEVSNELLDEMKTELINGNNEEAIAIAENIIQNLEKINHHGKRADAIVKGMLQHSRMSSGQKELTDINVLADEYLRLSYHGLRAKDNTFNATIKTDFYNTLEKINMVPQDIGRVILNLYNNAFYALAEKKKQSPQSPEGGKAYEPTISVSTKKIGYKIEIKVADNGNGIPQNIVDKIFQPFFTTKPTGQGTGLGLSLSYDIVKAHGGEIKAETKEGEGTEFIIQLPIKTI